MFKKQPKKGADRIDSLAEDLVRQDVEGWQQSQERVLRYLKAIGAPPVQSLELAYETMKRAADELSRQDEFREHPVRIVMRLLGQVLAETDLSIIYPNQAEYFSLSGPSQIVPEITPPGLPPQLGKALPVTPDLKRGSMLPDMHPAHLFKSFFAFFISRKIASS